MRTITTNVYTIDEHPNKEKVFNWIRNNWHDLNSHSVYEIIDSLKALKKEIGGELDYAISTVPDRGEFISLKDYDKEALMNLNPDNCPLTGVCWDYEVIKGFQESNETMVLDSLHTDTEYLYSDEGLTEFCEINEYEFTEEGEFI